MRRTAIILAGTILAFAAAAAPASALPSTWAKGFNYTAWWYDTYATSSAGTSLTNLKATGANSVAIIATWYQNDANSTTIAPDPQRSPTDASVRTAIARAKALGLKVMLRPMVDSQNGSFRGAFTPSSVSAWFTSYRAMISHYASLAAAEGVDSMQVGVEYKSLSGNEAEWRSVVAAVRARYAGELTYAANWDEYQNVRWWDAVDTIGIDAYFPLASATAAAWDTWIAQIATVQARFAKPVVFTEIGYTSTLNNLSTPWAIGGTYDGPSQQVAYDAMFRAFETKSWFRGMYVWNWSTNPLAGGVGHTGHTPQNKPGQATMTAWYSATTTTPPPPTTTPPPTCTKKNRKACASASMRRSLARCARVKRGAKRIRATKRCRA